MVLGRTQLHGSTEYVMHDTSSYQWCKLVSTFVIHLSYIIGTSWLIKVRHSETIPCSVSDLHESYLSVVLAVPTAALYDHMNATLEAADFYTFLSFEVLTWFWRQHKGHWLCTWYSFLNLTLNCTIKKSQDNRTVNFHAAIFPLVTIINCIQGRYKV